MIRTGSCYTISIKQNRLYISKSLRKKNKTFSPSAFCYIVRKKQDNVNICVLSFPFFLYYNTYIEIFIHRFKRIISPSTKLYHSLIRRSLL